MKRYYIGLLSLLLAGALPAQNTVKMSAVKSNDFGVSYTLPKTTIVIKADATKTTRKAGDFYEYAERYLNISNPITQDETIYTINALTATTGAVPDKEKSYLVEFRSGTTAPFVTLTKDGLICAINADAQFSPVEQAANTAAEEAAKALPNPNSFLSEETLRAGSKAKQAELISKQIFLLRETRNNILTGEADNMPPDGNAYKLVMERLDLQEKALTSMFSGNESVESLSKSYTVIPTTKDISNQIVFRFSKKLGFVESENMAGAPVTLTLINKEPAGEPPVLSPKDQKAWDDKFAKGIIYNIPAKASMKVDFDNKTWVNKEIDVVQYGKQEVLIPKMFENNKQPVKVIFFPEMGAIKQIIQ
ncbi:uncharacterized protein DUF4831 [Dysgonomonas alginatilytica]|uniref:Uncharacterized protein DUF4831 n=1 Tax=Dysgonomonas alginatilytica TaxID=1605892 RepID=A0A2V3PTN0_9BACT|nr:DUF4831 family protein [Dysgonomonas alginatilytica]PXV68983.1 uncharacterized protein DUF4831 [Dysgonomonas alginatilytica]